MKHADRLIKRVLFLDGLPNLQDLGKLLIGENVAGMPGMRLEAGADGAQGSEGRHCDSESLSDYVSRELFESILESEEEHIDFLETQLELIKRGGVSRITASRRWVRARKTKKGRSQPLRAGRLGSLDLLRQRNRQFQNLVTLVALQVDDHGFGINVHILADHFQQFAAQQRQIVRTAAGPAFLRDDDAKSLFCHLGRRGAGGEKYPVDPCSTSKQASKEPSFGLIDES